MDYTEKTFPKPILHEIQKLRKKILKCQLFHVIKLSNIDWDSKYHTKKKKCKRATIILTVTIFCLIFGLINFNLIAEYLLSIRCFVPNNYLVYEASRPIEFDCKFCFGVQRPLLLQNLTKAEFLRYAYLPQPIIIKNAFMHWPAREHLTYQYLKDMYNKWPDALNSFSDECQFLPFKSTFTSLSEFFNMSESMVYSGGWYVGFSNCHPNILQELRKLYPRPHFLPTDAEMPNTDYTFLGNGEGAVMHLDYIPRLMWQAQLQGRKSWYISPTPECDSKCASFSFYVEPGDAILLDTRMWYHRTHVYEFSITIQSEYG